MEQFIERELKILVTKEVFEKILNSYEFKKPVDQTNTYYDSNDEFLKKQRGAMRIRTIQDKKIFTLKLRKDDVTHYEYEKEIDVDTLQAIKDKEIQKWLSDFNIPKDVSPIVTFSTRRYTCDLENGQLCADMTSYENHIDYELEYEYFNDHNGIKVFNEILKPFGLTYKKNCSSKIARAMQR